MNLISLYEEDSTGKKGSNKVTNESITIIPPASVKDFSYFCPRGAPFYAESLVIKNGTTAGARTLIKDVDYRIVFKFVSASLHYNKDIYAGIQLLDPTYSGTLYVTYQALGGNYTLADFSILEDIVRRKYADVHIAYEQIINLPAGFSPAYHKHLTKDMVSMSAVVNQLQLIVEAIKSRNGSFSELVAKLNSHLESTNAHTKSQVGLDKVSNFGVATDKDITNGAADKYVTADKLKIALSNLNVNTSNFVTTKMLDNLKTNLTNLINEQVNKLTTVTNIVNNLPDFNTFVRKNNELDNKFSYIILPDLAVTTTVSQPFTTVLGISVTDTLNKVLTGRAYRVITGSVKVTITLDRLSTLTDSQVKAIPFTIRNGTTQQMVIVNGAIKRYLDPEQTATILIKGINSYDIIGGYGESK